MKQWANRYPSMPTEIIKPLILQGVKDTTLDWGYNIKEVKAHFPNGRFEFLKKTNHHIANEVKEIRIVMFDKFKNYFDVQHNLN